jgi:hypothetical protein
MAKEPSAAERMIGEELKLVEEMLSSVQRLTIEEESNVR